MRLLTSLYGMCTRKTFKLFEKALKAHGTYQANAETNITFGK